MQIARFSQLFTNGSRKTALQTAVSSFCLLSFGFAATSLNQAVQAQDLISHLAQIGMTAELAAKYNGENVKVAVIDTLIDTEHDRLNVTESYIFPGQEYSGPGYHGTHVAGLIGASRDGFTGFHGVAAGAEFINYGIFGDTGAAYFDTAEILNHAISRGATVANASYGIGGGNISYNQELQGIASVGNKLLMVKAAGNDGLNAEHMNFRGEVSELTNTLFVGSVDANNQISHFSNRPGEACITYSGCSDDEKIKHRFLVAPGENIFSTLDGNSYGFLSGTSMATPLVTGAAGLIQSNWEWLKADANKTSDILLNSATDLGEAGVDAVYGHGLLNVGAALAPLGDISIEVPEIEQPPAEEEGTPPTTTEPPVVDEPVEETRAERRRRLRAERRAARREARRKAREDRIRANSILSKAKLAGTSLKVFDSYGRDFEMNLADMADATAADSASAAFISGAKRMKRRDEIRRARRAARQAARNANRFADAGANALTSANSITNSITLGLRGDGAAELVDGNATGLVLGFGYGQQGFNTAGYNALGFAQAKQDQDFFDADSTGHNPILGLATSQAHAGVGFNGRNGWRFGASVHTQFGDDQETLQDDFDAGYNLAESGALDYSRIAMSANVGLDLGQRVKANLNYTNLLEEGSLLGGVTEGFFADGGNVRSQALTLGFDWQVNNKISLLASYTRSQTRQQDDGGSFYLADTLNADAFQLSVAANDIMSKGDNLSLAFSQPLRATSGNLYVQSNDVINRETGETGTVSQLVDLGASSRQMDLKMAYRNDMAGGKGWFETRALVSLNEGHVADQTVYGVGANVGFSF